MGLPSYVFIPADLEEQKVLGTGVYGANVVSVRGNYDEVNRLCTEVSAEHDDWAFVNINMRPYYSEGSKTVAFEIVEQLGWELPDRCVVPIASGSLFTKIHRGFAEWLELGLVERLGAGDERGAGDGLRARRHRVRGGPDFCQPVKPDTIAKSLAIGNPADGPYVLDLARRTGGSSTRSTDEQIREGIALLAQTTGIFTETAGGVSVAVLGELARRGDIGADERVVLVITGDGLKTLDAVRGTFEVTRSTRRSKPSRRRGAGDRLMAVTVKIPAQLRGATGGASEARVEGATVAEVLEALFAQFGELRERISDEHGALRRFVNVYLVGRGHPLPRRRRDERSGRLRADHPSGCRRGLEARSVRWLTSRRKRTTQAARSFLSLLVPGAILTA